jgi:basic membrane protein A
MVSIVEVIRRAALAGGMCVAMTFASFVSPARADEPKQLKIAAVFASAPDDPWNATLLMAWNEVKAEKPHGLELNDPVYIENAWGDAAEAALRLYARKGYDIIWAASSYSDQVQRIRAQYPNTLFVLTGAPNEPIGGNVYLVYNRIFEPAYLAGIMAGKLTKSGVVGAVGGYPTEDTNDAINAFFAGARSVRPDLKQKVSFIASWWDPPMATEAMKAQVSSGVDQELMLSSAFDACKTQKVTCYGGYRDWNSVAPQNIATSALGNWRPSFEWIIDQWYEARASGKPFNGNMDKRYFGMARGGASLAPYHGYPVPPDVAARVDQVRTEIEKNQFAVPLDIAKPVSSN